MQKYHAATDHRPLVLDAYHGQGLIWRELCKKYPCKVIGLDVKEVKGTLKISNLVYMRHFDLPYEVIDLDAYGEPWQAWDCVLQRSPKSAVTIFMTQCWVGTGGGAMSHLWKSRCGLPVATPNWLAWRARDYIRQVALARCLSKWRVVEAKQVLDNNVLGSPSRHWYIGLRLVRGLNDAAHLSA